jgi:hypothetical protein
MFRTYGLPYDSAFGPSEYEKRQAVREQEDEQRMKHYNESKINQDDYKKQIEETKKMKIKASF